MLYLGCDQHAKQITVCLRDEVGELIVKRQVSTKPEKIQAFLWDVNQQAGEAGWMAILEACGFNDWFLALLKQTGCAEVVVVHPEKPGKKKTDRRDADKLCQLLWVHRDQLRDGKKPIGIRRVVMPSAQDAEDRQLTATRQRAGQQRTRTINAVQAILRKHNLGWQQPTKGIETKTAKRWLSGLSLPDIDRLEMDHLLARWALWDEQLSELNAQIAERAAKSPAVQIIKTAPGFSDYGALGIASRIGDVSRFKSPRSLANYFGLTPSSRSTGGNDRLGSITKEGSRFARFLLAQVVLHVLKRDKEMRAWYQRIKRRRGSKIARVAVMRRLCTILWHMLTYQEAYTFGGPPRLRLRRSPRQKTNSDRAIPASAAWGPSDRRAGPNPAASALCSAARPHPAEAQSPTN